MIHYLNLRHRNRIVPNIEGSELSDVEAIRQEAIVAAREMMADAVRRGEDISARVFKIVDENLGVLDEVPFVEPVGQSA